jgi:hypothetical protein
MAAVLSCSSRIRTQLINESSPSLVKSVHVPVMFGATQEYLTTSEDFFLRSTISTLFTKQKTP